MKNVSKIISIVLGSLLILMSDISVGQEYLHTNERNIFVVVNDNGIRWRVSPEINPDRYHVFCKNDGSTNRVEFISGIDSTSFTVQNHDTIRFSVILRETDTAYTEVVGVHSLPSQISTQEKLYYLGLIWSESKYNFMNIDQLCFDWDSLYMAYIDVVIQTENDFDYYRALQSFVAQLNDGHTSVNNGGQFARFLDYIPFTIDHLDQRVFVTSIRDDIAGRIEVGAEIISVNGKSVIDFLEDDIFPYISTSTPDHKWAVAMNSFTYGYRGEPLEVTWKNSNGTVKTVVFERNGESTRYNREGENKYQRHGVQRVFKPNLDLTYTTDSIAVLEFNRFHPEKETISAFLQLMPSLQKAKGLIIDIRNNGGGSTGVAHEVIKRIIRQDWFLGLAAETRINDAVYKAMGFGYEEYKPYYENRVYRQEDADTIFIADTIERLDYPIAILIGVNTGSAAEDFLLMLYEIEERPLLIGTPTAGTTGAPLVIPGLPGGGFARICARRCKYPYSLKPFVNEGIQPDIHVFRTVEEILNGEDAALNQAIDILSEKIKM